jgi:hypothetical protein
VGLSVTDATPLLSVSAESALNVPNPEPTVNETTTRLTADEPLVTLAVTVTGEADDTVVLLNDKATLTVLLEEPPSKMESPELPPPPPQAARLITSIQENIHWKSFNI